MYWKLRTKSKPQVFLEKLDFASREDANDYIDQMGAAFHKVYEAWPNTDKKTTRMLMEGLVAGDLRRIILPQISVDEYVPGDPETDNVVIAFFIKGVPEAVIPFRDFIMKCRGILDVAYGDSDTIPNTSIIYAEMARGDFDFEAVQDMMEQVSLLCDIEPEDFSMVFPTSSKRFPYDLSVLQAYIQNRDERENIQAQKDALKKADDDQETTGADEEDSERVSQDEADDAMVEHLVEMFGR